MTLCYAERVFALCASSTAVNSQASLVGWGSGYVFRAAFPLDVRAQFGTIAVNGTGDGKTPTPNFDSPLDFRRKAMETIDASQSK